MSALVSTAARRSFPGLSRQIGEARAWVLEQLPVPPDSARAADIALVTSELVTNVIVHSSSGRPGGRFELLVSLEPGSSASVGSARLTCIDMGPTLCPRPRDEGEFGRGLPIVRALATDYKVTEAPAERIVCCRLTWSSSGTTI